MKILHVLLMFLLTVSGYAQDVPIGSYNPEEDQTVLNNSGLERVLVNFSERTQKFFTRLNPEGYVDGPFTDFFTFVASALALVALHFFYAKVIFRRKRYGRDVNKMLYRYKLVMISLAVIMTIILLKDSFIWGSALLVADLVLLPVLNGLMRGNMCPNCCSYSRMNRKEVGTGIYSNEIYSTGTRVSQYLQAHEISKESLPYGEFELYHVEKIRHFGKCDRCGYEWEYEQWKRIKKL